MKKVVESESKNLIFISIAIVVSVMVVLGVVGFFIYKKYSNQLDKDNLELGGLFAFGLTGPNNCSTISECVDYCEENSGSCVKFCNDNPENDFCKLAMSLVDLEKLKKELEASFKNEPSSGGVSGSQVSDAINNPSASEECTLSISPNPVCAGDLVTGRLTSTPNTNCYLFVNQGGEWATFEGTTDNSGVWENIGVIIHSGNYNVVGFCDKDNSGDFTDGDCFTNPITLLVEDCADDVPDAPPSWSVGDVVGGGSGSGTLAGSDFLNVGFDLSDSGLVLGGECYLGAKISMEWSYENPQECFYMQGIGQSILISFADSVKTVWQYNSLFPESIYKELCPLEWDGSSAFSLVIDPLDEEIVPNCRINYTYNVIIDICRCDEEQEEQNSGQQTCTDTDGGKDYFTKGQVTGYMEGGYFLDGSWDACTSATRLSEYFCYQKDGTWYAMWETYNCENSNMICQNGKCISVI